MEEDTEAQEMPWELHEPLSSIGAILKENEVDDETIQATIDEIRAIVVSALVEADDEDSGSESEPDAEMRS